MTELALQRWIAAIFFALVALVGIAVEAVNNEHADPTTVGEFTGSVTR